MLSTYGDARPPRASNGILELRELCDTVPGLPFGETLPGDGRCTGTESASRGPSRTTCPETEALGVRHRYIGLAACRARNRPRMPAWPPFGGGPTRPRIESSSRRILAGSAVFVPGSDRRSRQSDPESGRT